MKRIISLVFATLLISTFSYSQNVLRSGLGFSIYNAGVDTRELMIGPSLYGEYSYQLFPFLSLDCNLHTDLCLYGQKDGGFKGALGIRTLFRPFPNVKVLNRLFLGLGPSIEYRGYFNGNIQSASFLPGIDFPVRLLLFSSEKFDLMAIYEPKTIFMKDNKYVWNYSNAGILFGVKF